MKALDSPLRLFVLISLILIGISGCNNTVTDPINDKENIAHSEKDFVNNSNLRATPSAIIALNLEDFNSPVVDSIPDTGIWGQDEIYVRYTNNVTRTFRMESTARFSVSMRNIETGQWLYYMDWNSPIATVQVSAGDYVLYFRSWLNFALDSTLGHQTIFVQPEQSNPLNTFFSLGGCRNCDLSYINLDHMDLSHMDFSGANFTKSNISAAQLNYSIFSNTNFENAYLYNSVVIASDFSNSLMKGVIFRSSDLEYTSFMNCDLSNSDFRFANIGNGTFCGANKTGIITNGITFNGNTQCWP